MTTTTAPALPALIDFLRSERGDFAASLCRYYDRHGTLTERQEIAAANMYARKQATQAAPAAPQIEPGFYLKDGSIYKAKRSQAGNLYAMRREADGSFTYAGSPARSGLTPDHRITAEIAAAHGIATGICIFCNAELDDREGLGALIGIGPICARKHLGESQRQIAERLGLLGENADAAREALTAAL